MKILHTADWHIKLGQKNVPVEWATNRYRMFFSKLKDLESQVDLHIATGDIFDRTPRLDELQLFFEYIANVGVQTIITTGNHEADKKNSSFFRFLKPVVETMNPLVEVVLEVKDYGDFYVVPYEFIKKEDTWKKLEEKPVFTHVRGTIEPHVTAEIPLEWLEKFPVVFAGDLHSYQNCQGNICYPGSPMTTSFHRSENNNANGYFIISLQGELHNKEWNDFGLPQLIRKTVQDKSDMLATDYHHTIYELEGNVEELAGNIDSELLDKKIIKRTSDVELILTERMTIEDELVEYLTYIVEHPNIPEVMTAYHEYD